MYVLDRSQSELFEDKDLVYLVWKSIAISFDRVGKSRSGNTVKAVALLRESWRKRNSS